MLGAPVGTCIGRQVPEALLLLSFAALMLCGRRDDVAQGDEESRGGGGRAGTGRPRRPADEAGPACRRDPAGRLR